MTAPDPSGCNTQTLSLPANEEQSPNVSNFEAERLIPEKNETVGLQMQR